jgi:hypothetical protein
VRREEGEKRERISIDKKPKTKSEGSSRPQIILHTRTK